MWVRFPYEEIQYFLFKFFRSSVETKLGVEYLYSAIAIAFSGKWVRSFIFSPIFLLGKWSKSMLQFISVAKSYNSNYYDLITVINHIILSNQLRAVFRKQQDRQREIGVTVKLVVSSILTGSTEIFIYIYIYISSLWCRGIARR